MKHLFVFALVLLAGCAAGPTMEELEDEAMQTGDWSKVEDREQLRAQRMGRAQNECPEGYAVFCRSEVGFEDCDCVSREVYDEMFGQSISAQPANPAQRNR